MSTASLIDVGARFREPTWRSARSPITETAVTSLRNGEMVMLCDDVSGSTRYDLVCVADQLTTAQTSFLVRHTSGYLQVALSDETCDRLQLPPVSPTGDRMSAQQCVGVDAAVGVGTGISAADRTHTINVLGNREAAPGDFTRPGHVVPVRVASVPRPHDLAALALALAESSGAMAAVFATVVGIEHDLTGLMNHSEAQEFATRHQVPIIDYTAVVRARQSA